MKKSIYLRQEIIDIDNIIFDIILLHFFIDEFL